MKIVRVIARLNVGGPAKHVVWLTKGLERVDCQTVLVAGTVPPGEDDMAYFADELGVSPVFIPEMSREISAKDFITVWKLYKLLRREKPDIIHTHTAKAGTVGRLAGFFYRWLTPSALLGRPRQCRLVHTYHGHIFHSYYGPLKTRLFLAIEKTLGRFATDRIVVISDQQQKEINERFGVATRDRFAVIPLGMELDDFAEWEMRGKAFRRELAIDETEVLVGIVGRLTDVKNHKLFLRAVAEYKRLFGTEQPKVRFVVVGGGGLREQLLEQTAELGITSDVEFVGNRRDLDEIYPALDIVALTSLNEGTPLTLIEAMANARPIIATAAGGVVDLLGTATEAGPDLTYKLCERGISVGHEDAIGFASGLYQLVSNEGLRRELGQRGLQFVHQQYSTDRLFDDIHSLYQKLLAETTTRAANSVERHRVV